MNEVTRGPLRFYGGGWMRAKWTLGYVPRHPELTTWVDLCFGAGSITARKEVWPNEIINDRDGRVINFMKVLRDDDLAARLVELINLTPWAEDEMRECLAISDDPLEDARRFFAICWMSVHGGPTAQYASFRFQKSAENRHVAPAYDAIDRHDLLAFGRRLKKVHVFNRDAIGLIKKYGVVDTAVQYFDPPYLRKTRARKNGYRYEVSAAWHRLAAYWLRKARGPVLVAGYRSRLYERCYEDYGWQRVEREQKTNGKSTAIECLWLSPITLFWLERQQEMKVAEAYPLLALADQL